MQSVKYQYKYNTTKSRVSTRANTHIVLDTLSQVESDISLYKTHKRKTECYRSIIIINIYLCTNVIKDLLVIPSVRVLNVIDLTRLPDLCTDNF